MTLAFRVIVTALCAVATFYFVFWLPFSLVLPHRTSNVIPTLGSAACALAAGTYVWRRVGAVPEGIVSAAVTGALVVGGVGFVAGFFGPMVFTPGANQGPLLGIFFTGPLGAVLGAAGGALYGWARREKRAAVGPRGPRP